MTFTASEMKYLHGLQARLSKPLTLRVGRNERPESKLVADFGQALAAALPQVKVVTEDVPAAELPGLVLGEGWRWHGVPEGAKLELLAEMLLAVAGQGPELPPEVRSRWETLPLAPALVMFIAPQCPFCPQMVRQLLPLASARPVPGLAVIDASLFLETAREYEIKAVPTVIVNGVYRLTGAFTLTDLLDLAGKTDPSQLPEAVLERMLQEGQAILLGGLMLAKGAIFEKVLPLVRHPEINVRLGVAVALETVGEDRPDLVAGILPRLWEMYAGSDLSARGDIAYLIGEWGDGRWREPLAAARAAADEAELQEALEEALAKIQDRD